VSGDRNVENRILSKKWLNMNDDLIYRKIINCTNRNQIKDIGQSLNRVES
jgi:hypothetical protein